MMENQSFYLCLALSLVFHSVFRCLTFFAFSESIENKFALVLAATSCWLCTDDDYCCAMSESIDLRSVFLTFACVVRFLIGTDRRTLFCYRLKIASDKFDFVTPSHKVSKQTMRMCTNDEDIGERNSTLI